jgi:acylglycerol lipase
LGGYIKLNFFLKHKFRDRPIYLGGHSSGAGLVLNYSCWQKSLAVNSYIIVVPEFGYRASVKRIQGEDFARVKLKPIIANRLSGGYLCGDSLAVKFNYSKDMIESDGLFPGYTVNMCRAVTPEDPVTALTNIKSPTYILISE